MKTELGNGSVGDMAIPGPWIRMSMLPRLDGKYGCVERYLCPLRADGIIKTMLCTAD